MKYEKVTLLAAVAIVIMFSGLSQAATKGRILTNNKVTLHKNGNQIATYTSQAPLDENALIACDGTCMVKMKSLSLTGSDKSVFAVRDSGDSLNLYVKSGRINFALADVSRQFVFYAPDGNFVKSEGFVSPASSGSSVKGFMQVTDKGTEIGMENGTMLVMTKDGLQSVGPGQSMVLAMLPDDGQGGGQDGGQGDALGSLPFKQIGLGALGLGAAFGIGELTFNKSSSSISVNQ